MPDAVAVADAAVLADVPRCTYRLQLRGGVGFAQARDLVPYLDRLGVSHLYLSPPFKARPGSTHGYDVADPNVLDPDLGGTAAFEALCGALRSRGMGLILDIVPNHMGVGPDNPWWWDVLEHGRGSRYAGFFDIDFDRDPGGRLVLPVLGAPLEEVLAKGE
ncbi:MAG TPA: alpha-amylase family glycosyl hydrolase, partial [Geminicoccaceae bacterium]